MAEAIVDRIVQAFSGSVPPELIVFFISMLPVIELRGGMIAAKLLGLDLNIAFLICYIGNLVPIPFILLFIRRIFSLLRRRKSFAKFIEKLERKTMLKSEKASQYKGLGLLAFVAIPLPGTGGWTGALLAALMEMRFRVSLPLIALGVLIADLIMALLSYGLPGLFGF